VAVAAAALIVPRLAKAAIDRLGVDDASDLVDRSAHRRLHGERRLPAVLAGERRRRLRERRRASAAVAARRAEARDLTVHDHDMHVRLGSSEEVRRPQTRQAGAHDHHVGVAVARKRTVRRPVVARRLVSQRQRAIPGPVRVQRTPQD
jgi:hypothetical protein